MSVETPEQATSIIKRWMEDRGFFTADKTDDESYFLFEGSCGDGLNFVIQQPKTMKRVVGALMRLAFDSQHIAALNSMPPDERSNFIWDLRRDLMFIPPSVSFSPDVDNPESIFIVKEISYDELTEGNLNEAVDQNIRALIWVSISLIRKFGVPNEE